MESLRFVDELLPIDEDLAPVVHLDFSRARNAAREVTDGHDTSAGEILALFA